MAKAERDSVGPTTESFRMAMKVTDPLRSPGVGERWIGADACQAG